MLFGQMRDRLLDHERELKDDARQRLGNHPQLERMIDVLTDRFRMLRQDLDSLEKTGHHITLNIAGLPSIR